MASPTSAGGSAETETFGFDADIQQLLRLIINAFYSDKSVFLRELLSNSSDALDKIRLESLTTPAALGEASELLVRITPDKEARMLTIEDTGIGMTREELVRNLGTVARSGTRAFTEALEKGAHSSLIGQFGVGFYSAFLVADQVRVTSKHNSDKQYVWSSSADGSFTVSLDDKSAKPLTRGTRVELFLKEGMDEHLQEFGLRSLITRHCSFITYPIELWTTKTVDVPKPAEGDTETSTDDGNPQSLGPKDDKAKPETVKQEVSEYQRVNVTQPIWTKSPSDVTEDEYKEFYKAISNDWDDYAVKRHFVGEGTVEFQALLFVPKHPPFDMLMGVAGQGGKQKNVKLYARKVMIMDEFDEFMPPYLGFVKGVVNSDDIPLNVSRELLQDNKMLKFIARNLVKRCLEMFAELAVDQSAYKTFYNAFSTNLKLGVHEDSANRDKLVELLRFPSNRSLSEDASAGDKDKKVEDPMAALMGGAGHQGSMVSLKEYVERMPEDQNEIYVLTGESVKSIDASPFMEKFRELNLEVLYMAEPIDEYVLTALSSTPYQEKRLVNISKEGVRLPGADATKSDAKSGGEREEEKEAEKEAEKDTACELVKQILGSKVMKVEVSDQLVQSPCAISVPQHAQSANMERIMRAQALQSQEQRMMMNPMMAQRTLLLNSSHRLIAWLRDAASGSGGLDKAAKDEKVCETVQLLLDTALMNSGFPLDEPASVASRIQSLLVSKL